MSMIDRGRDASFRTTVRSQLSDPLHDSGVAAAQRGDRLMAPGTATFPYTPTGPLAQDNASIESYIRMNYGYLATFLNNPEIGPILRQAAREGWDQNRLYGALQATNWWRSTSASAREWENMLALDPAEAAAKAAETAANIQNRARTLGLPMSVGQIQNMATEATKYGWTDAQVIDHLLSTLNWSQVKGGDLTALRDQVKSIGASQLVRVSDATAQNYAAAIASGEMTEAGVASIMQAQAASRFSWMRDQLAAGVTASQYLAPIRDVIANELERQPEAIDMMDPKWLSMIETRDAKTGEMRSATQEEAMLAARRQPEYWNTKKAKELAVQFDTAFAEVFGRRGL